eukprot:gnl/MRDRNA2_/MRDRNA2_126431_c0_seq1.p1 gnl/MRDRNA2_/MRDRNA2_126431_c0~~gnl/MRDRNA2_/MRDRNA2_126431_c0_seq1.p1  ORF type:complete len:466 (+),score=59.95 gnl/MRDRNA2_/MRDRNA2_126431_c0_seq1:149-1546(+)
MFFAQATKGVAVFLLIVLIRPEASAVLFLGQNHRSYPHDVRLKLNNWKNIQYIGKFTVGGQELPVIYDTGSFEILVLSDLCKRCRTQGPIYRSSQSSTFDPGSRLVGKHVFGSGPVLSKKALETVKVGNTQSPLVATEMPFWMIMDHNVPVWNEYSQFSGIIGLGHTSTAPTQDTKDVEDPSILTKVGVTAFAVCLERSSGTPPGWLTLGPTAEKAQGDWRFKHVPVTGTHHWSVDMTYLRAAGWEADKNACKPSCSAIVDSGTSLIAAPPVVMKALAPVLNKVDSQCRYLDQLPDITFYLGEMRFELPPSIYVIKVKTVVEKQKSGWESMWGESEKVVVTRCIPAFQEFNMQSSNGSPVWILGSPFLRYHYTVFQREPKSIHFAYSTSDCYPSATEPSIYLSNRTKQNRSAHSNQNVRHNISRDGDIANDSSSSIPTIDDLHEAVWPVWAKHCRNATEICLVTL